jgi:hypothetical protein
MSPIGVSPSVTNNNAGSPVNVSAPTKIEIHGAGNPMDTLNLLRNAESVRNTNLLRTMRRAAQ